MNPHPPTDEPHQGGFTIPTEAGKDGLVRERAVDCGNGPSLHLSLAPHASRWSEA